MKKALFMAALVLISAGSFAQKKNVNIAKNLCLAEEGADYDAARRAIGEALTNDQTKEDAQTWYVAGLIEFQDAQKMLSNHSEDYITMGEKVVKSLDYWKKADELAMTPQKDKKGRVIQDKKGNYKYDLRTRKDIADKIKQYYQQQVLIACGGTLFGNQDFVGASKMYNAHIAIVDMPMMQESKYQDVMPKDTLYQDYMFDAGRLAYYGKEYDESIRLLEPMVNGDWKPVLAGEFLYQCYIDKGDSAKANEVLDMCITKFPKEAWFMQNRINNLVNAGDQDGAVVYLQKAIEADPQGQYYNSLGSIFSLQKKFADAFKMFDKAIEMEPANPLFQQSYGFGYIDLANMYDMQASAPGVDDKTYKQLRNKMTDANKQALKYFEKAHELAPDNYDFTRTLRQLYYRLGMMEEYNALAD